MTITVAIVGRPNVGKSTLFNRLIGRRLALVDDRPGVTRDIREGIAGSGGVRFTILDTAGVCGPETVSFEADLRKMTDGAIKACDACLFVVDARAGVTGADRDLAAMLRKRASRVILLANKAEARDAVAGSHEFYALGIGEPMPISAEHGEGIGTVLDRLRMIAEERAETAERPETFRTEPGELGGACTAGNHAGRPIQIAVIGRPNAGKSTLVNRIVGYERFLTGPEAGITRDAISVSIDWRGTPVRIWDTAGLRRKSRVRERLERLSVSDALRAVRFSDVVVVLMDAGCPLESQDLKIADLAVQEGRAVVVAANKWDCGSGRRWTAADLGERFTRLLPQLRGAPLLMISARTGKGLERLQDAVVSAHDVWNRRVPTADLNRWLADMLALHPPPAPGGRRVRMRYITQVKTRPPGFIIMCSRPEEIDESYRRYLINGLRDDFDFPGTPIRLTLRARPERNPFRTGKSVRPGRRG